MMPNNIFQILTQIKPGLNGLQNVSNPDEAAQFLLNSGRVTQEQVNHVKQMWNNQPNIRQMIQNKYKY